MNDVALQTVAKIDLARAPKNDVSVDRSYAFFVEAEHTADGVVENVATIFLANRECPYRCLMCDLWRNTTDVSVPRGAIPRQIDYALDRLPPAQHVKLYNSGNFFDAKAIPRADFPPIARRVGSFKTVIVENHPNLCRGQCLDFRDLLPTKLEIAMGLETVHPKVLPALGKRMTLADFERATQFLTRHEIAVRAFILLPAPFLDDDEGTAWAIRSMEFAFAAGVNCCSLIPTRADSGVMRRLSDQGLLHPARLASLEVAQEAGLQLRRGRVFVDLWDVERLASCQQCGAWRIARLRNMNLTQKVPPAISCNCGAG